MADAIYHTLSCTLSYNGAPFLGFARQADADIPTVQGDFEHALWVLFKREIKTVCAGRTDAGVHARAQVVSFDLSTAELSIHPLEKLKRSLNAITHEAITIQDIKQRLLGFSARFDAKSREYRYFLCTDDTPSLFLRDFTWHIRVPLDMDALRMAASVLIGEHDFKSFCKASSADGKPTTRRILDISVTQESVLEDQLVVIAVVGNAFLHSMVRTMVGTLVSVGKGLRDPSWVADVLISCDRRCAGECAPAQGLVLWKVEY